jgi:exodeoxyribonuclease III
MRIISFNVNGIRAIMNKDFDKSMEAMAPDIICFQETKAQEDQVAEALKDFTNAFELYAYSAEKKGYSSTAILTKTKPLSVQKGIGIEEHDNEGRVLTLEFDEFYLTTVYVPNSGSELLRLGYRQTWDAAFLAFLKNLEKTKPVLVCGDFNVAHKPIDLARPKENYNKAAGYMQEEIDGMDAFTSNGILDTFRALNGDEVKYSWWSYRAGAREKNVGWRIDYFLASESFMPHIKKAMILNDIYGSDHCPVGVEIA